MKRNTIKWKIYQYNLLIIFMLIIATTIAFNIVINLYIKKDILNQLEKISKRTEKIMLLNRRELIKPPKDIMRSEIAQIYEYKNYYIINKALKEPLSVINAEFILLDNEKNIITDSIQDYITYSNSKEEILNEISKSNSFEDESYVDFKMDGKEYIAIIRPIKKNDENPEASWIIIFSSLEKFNQLRLGINIILVIVIVVSAIILSVFSSYFAKKITKPFSTLNEHINEIAKRNFGTKIKNNVYEELRDLVDNINNMSEKLYVHDKSQKTFLQNASHEFRTPLMSIQSYAEGIKHNVVENDTAVDIIISESKRMTKLVEDLLYLSRLDSLEENYTFIDLKLDDILKECINRVKGVTIKENKKMIYKNKIEKYIVKVDEEKFVRAIMNLINNCIRYCKNYVKIEVIKKESIEIYISDDGEGFRKDELPFIFDRFYKGNKGNYGLGLSIAKNIINKHNLQIKAENLTNGALYIIKKHKE
ncbi:MAG: HAMP domain-containing sensor histidine kinase [Clostridiales bacterium]